MSCRRKKFYQFLILSLIVYIASGFSNPITFVHATDSQAPRPPQNLDFSEITNSSVTLIWEQSNDSNVKGYSVFQNNQNIGTVTGNTYTVVGLKESTAYSFFLKAINEVGNTSEGSNVINIDTGVSGTNVIQPSFTIASTTSLFSFEIEDLVQRDSGKLTTTYTTETASGGKWEYYNSNTIGDYVEYEVNVPQAGTYKLKTVYRTGDNRGIVKLTVDGKEQGSPLDLYSSAAQFQEADFGSITFAAPGIKVIRFTVTGKNTSSTDYKLGYDVIKLESGSTDTTAPTVPSNIIATNKTSNSITLGWNASTDNVGVSGYEVYRGTTLVGVATGTTYTVTGLAANTTYSFTVKAKDAAGNISPASSALSVTTVGQSYSFEIEDLVQRDSGKLTTTYTTETASGGKWEYYNSNTIGDYVEYEVNVPQAGTYKLKTVYRTGDNRGIVKLTVDGKEQGSPLDLYSSAAQFQEADFGSITFATPGIKVIRFTVTGKNTSSTDYKLGYDVIKLESGSTDTTAPTVPSNIIATNKTSNSITLGWNASTDNVGVSGYEVYRGTTLVGVATGTTYTVTGLAANTTYSFTVKAKDAAGNISPASSALSVTTVGQSYSFEIEDLVQRDSGKLTTTYTTETASGGKWEYYNSNTIGDYVEYEVNVPQAGTYKLKTVYRTGDNRGIVKLTVDGKEQGSPLDLYSSAAQFQEADFGSITFATPGIKVIRFTVTGKNTSSTDYKLGYDVIKLESGSTDTTAPTVPSNIIATNKTSNSITLGWNASTDNVGVSGYEVYRGTTLVGVATGTTYTVTGLAANTTYSFTVKAKDAAGNISPASSALSVATLSTPDTEAPSTPINLVLSSKTANSVTIKWSSSTDNVGVTGYDIYRGTNLIGSATNTSYLITGLTENTSYNFSVVARDAAGNRSISSNVLNVKTNETTPPSAPANLGLDGKTGTTVTLKWSSSTDNVGVTGYNIYNDSNYIGSSSGTYYKVTGLNGLTTYSFSVKAKDAFGNLSTSSNILKVTTDESTPPTSPQNLVVTDKTGTSVSLAWKPSTDNIGVISYYIYNGTTFIGNTSNLNYTVTGLSGLTAYNFSIRARDAAGNESVSSNVVNVSTHEAVPPTIPANISVKSKTGTSVTLAWNGSTDNVGVTGYSIYNGNSLVGTTANTTFTIEGLVSYTNYTFTVRANDAAGNLSNPSNSVNVTTNDILAPTANKISGPSEVPFTDGGYFELLAEGVSDLGTGVDSVKFATWTESSGQDDLIWHDGSILSNGDWSTKVYLNQHKNEQGKYIIHVYAYDKSGNSQMVGSFNVIVLTNYYEYFYDRSGRLDYIRLRSGEILDFYYDNNGNLLKKELRNP
ncbi:fibronectin type III domain-containing protein [Paenibacillus sp. S-38]|uniref:fibronectin type III domain-containing protein n=1 Tax=Paenibacillus sp. S-38 TaxID=3416710 RepID=UPI003CED6656